jgi:DNA-binding GntR family transcriptional regulator
MLKKPEDKSMYAESENAHEGREKNASLSALPNFNNFEIATYSQRILHDLRQAIINGKLFPGQWLKESELSAAMKVSKTPIREALRHLESEGLIEIVPHKLVRVKELSPKEIMNIYSINALLESEAASLSCEYQNEEYIECLENLHMELAKYKRSNDFNGYNDANWRFHQAMISKCGNSKLLETNNSLKTLVMRYRFFSLQIPERMEKAFTEHETILQAIKNKKPSLVKRIVHEHIMMAAHALVKEVDKDYKSVFLRKRS